MERESRVWAVRAEKERVLITWDRLNICTVEMPRKQDKMPVLDLNNFRIHRNLTNRRKSLINKKKQFWPQKQGKWIWTREWQKDLVNWQRVPLSFICHSLYLNPHLVSHYLWIRMKFAQCQILTWSILNKLGTLIKKQKYKAVTGRGPNRAFKTGLLLILLL